MTKLDPRIHVAIRSYKRADTVKTLGPMPFAKIYVPESQAADYERNYPGSVIAIPDEMDGSPARKMNSVLDLSPSPWTLIVDDDITRVGYWEAGGHLWMEPDHIIAVINEGFRLADELGVKLWGIQQGNDELWHYTYRPFSLLAPVLGPFTGHLEPTLRYDETTLAKEDYDFWLQNILHHRKTLRLNKYHYACYHGRGLEGGITSMRTRQYELAGAERMRQKWGDTVYSLGGSAGGRWASGKNILNSKIRIPIPGC